MENTLAQLRTSVERIYQNQQSAEQYAKPIIDRVHPEQTLSITNLIHYLALRREDLRVLQDHLHDAGLSSLASAESHIMRQVQSVLQRLEVEFSRKEISSMDATTGANLLQTRARILFGSKKVKSIPHLMVTFESGMANDYRAVKALLKAGMNIARINSAHDDPEAWEKMIANVKRAVKSTGIPCKIYLDLAGPKIRTQLLGKGKKKDRLKLKEHSQFFLAESSAPYDKTERVIGCTLAGVVKDLRKGDRVLFDDGLFEAVVEIPGNEMATLRVTRVSAAKPFLKPEKGINFPDTELSVHCLTEYDKSVIPFALEHADLLGFSFVRSAADVAELQALLRTESGKKIPIILKIETFEAVQNLPELLLQGMQDPLFGVMIARGDLAVEIGFERLSEVQEEILWLCEAAHVPVIWATQVLESLNKSGIATRSEVSDAVRAAQAECVMLNKGKYLLMVLATLKDILQRSAGHHAKKRYLFRPLKIAERFLGARV
jgi:pyruvate kinase